ncbi:MAG: S49 family peptidase [Flavobacteriaceae bacterium]|jgi:protease-4|nr:S49 family peptidase [Flavobacteriaceae bacterium]
MDRDYLFSAIPNFIIGAQQKTFLTPDEIDAEFKAKLNAQILSAQNSGANKYPVIIDIIGLIVKYSDWWYTGTQTIIQILKNFEANENISGVVLNIDSGGGFLSGTSELANFIFNMEKPTIGFTNGYVCSAANWIYAACKHRMASPFSDKIGSIGAFISFQDFTALFEKYGAKYYEIYAPQSSEKNIEFRELMKGNEKLYEQSLKESVDLFISEMRRFYGENLKDDGHVFAGRTYKPADALKIGLVDELGTLEDALQKF